MKETLRFDDIGIGLDGKPVALFQSSWGPCSMQRDLVAARQSVAIYYGHDPVEEALALVMLDTCFEGFRGTMDWRR